MQINRHGSFYIRNGWPTKILDAIFETPLLFSPNNELAAVDTLGVGRVIFVAQHACACCCRVCLNKWYKVPKGVQLTEVQQEKIVTEDDTVLIIGAGPTGICTLLCVMLKQPKRIIVCEKDENRIRFVNEHYPDVLTVTPEECLGFVLANNDHGGADVVLEVAGADSTFRLAWECARSNAIVTVVALYDQPQTLPLPDMYGKNLIFKTGGVDGCDCEETLQLIAEGKLNTEPLITHTYPLAKIDEAYELFENKRDGVFKVTVEC